MGYIHLGNALYRADPEAWQAIRDGLPDTVRADLAYNNAYWASFEGAAADASQKFYDTILKGYGQADGIRSYGTVVDLLVAYYRDAARTKRIGGLVHMNILVTLDRNYLPPLRVMLGSLLRNDPA